MYHQVSCGYVCKREKNIQFVRLVLAGVRVTNFLNIANWDLFFVTQDTFTVMIYRIGRQEGRLEGRQGGRQEDRQAVRQVDRQAGSNVGGQK
jgi:hypothetical protein